MPRPFKQLTPEPIVPVEGGAGGGAPGVNVEDHGTPIANNPHTTINLAGTVSVADAGGGTATITVTGGGGGGFSDNANAERLRKNPWIRRLENDVSVPIANLGIGTTILRDYTTGPELTCYSVMTVRDKFFFVGNPDGTSLNQGSLYVMSLYDYSYNSTTIPLNNLSHYADAPVDLIGVAGLGNPDVGSGGDFIFALLPNLSTYQLGYAYTDNVLPAGKVLYGNINSGTVVPGAAVRACYVAGGGGDPNFGLSATYGTGFVPMFAISSTNGHIYLTDANSNIHDAISTGDTPGAMFVDNEGFLWAALTTSKTLVKYSINFTNFTLAQVSSYSTPGVTALDMIQDGRRAWILWLDTNSVPHLSSWQLQDGTVGPSFDARLSALTDFKDIVDGYYDTTRDLIWTADQTSKALVAFNATSQATSKIVPIPASPINGQLPNTWTGVRRVVGDTTNVYVCDTPSTNPNNQLVAIVNQNSGQVVGLCQVNGLNSPKARDMAVNGNDLYVVARSTTNIPTSTVQRFSISAAISSYPSPVGPLATSAAGAWHVCAFDATNNLLWAGTNTSGSPPETLATMDPATLATINSSSFASSATFTMFFGLLSAFGSIWAGTASGSILRINPTTFPAGGSVTTITTSTSESQQLYADTVNNTILVADFFQHATSRVSVASNTQVSTFTSSSPIFYQVPVWTPSAIWVGSFHSPLSYWQRYTTGVGTETPLNQVPGYTTSFTGYTGRLGWDGTSLWLSWFQPIVSGLVSPLTKLNPETGELLGQFTGKGYEGTNYGLAVNPRGFTIDQSGTVIAPIYDPTLPGVQNIGIIQPASEDRYFNSIRGLAKPLGFAYGGRQFGQVNPSATTVTLSPVTATAMVNTAGGASTVNLIQPGSWPTQTNANGNTVDWTCTVGDATGNAATNHITVGGVSYQVEDPNTPGTFSTSITISKAWQVVTWQFDISQLRWKVLSSNASGGGSSLGVPSGYILVGNANPSTGTLDATHLQAIVDSSVSVTTVNAPDIGGATLVNQLLFRVTDDTAHAATNPISVHSGSNLEDPNNHGSYATTVQISVNSQSIDWQWTGSHWKIV